MDMMYRLVLVNPEMNPAYLQVTKTEAKKRIAAGNVLNFRLLSHRGPANLRDVLGRNDEIIVHGGQRRKWHGVLARKDTTYELV